MEKNSKREGELEESGLSVSRAVSIGVAGAVAAGVSVVRPVLGIGMGGMAPVVAEQMSIIMERRAHRLRASLEAHGVDLEGMSRENPRLSDEQLELLREVLATALGTDYQQKVAVVAR